MGTIVAAAPWDDSVVIPQSSPLPDRRSPSGSLPAPGASRRTRAALVGLVAVCTAASLTGCDLRFEASPGDLPELTGVAALRDAAARSETAAQARAKSLSAKATACESCREVLEGIASDSTARLEALGGVWDPWNGATPEGAESPAAVADAPLEVGEFATWMALSARRDLLAATDADIEGPDARLLASAALGRLASAQHLADTYDVDLAAGVEQVGLLDSRLSGVLEQSGTEDGGWGLEDLLDSSQSGADLLDGGWEGTGDGSATGSGSGTADGESGDSEGDSGNDADSGVDAPGQQSGDSAAPSLPQEVQQSAELSGAVRTWDCVAQMLPRAQVVDQAIDDASDRADRLLARASAMLDAGVADTREERCRLSTSDVPTLDALVLSADLDLFNSESESVRRRGVGLVTDDLETWLASGDTTPAPLPGTETD
ncbi:MAG: hypothetical protein ACTJGR_05095 [Pauljensenia sp.]